MAVWLLAGRGGTMEYVLSMLSPTLTFLATAGAVVFGLGAGYTFGFAEPHWADDSSLENVDYRGHYYYGYDGYGTGGCLFPMLLIGGGFGTVARTTWAPIVFTVLAGACVVLLWDSDAGLGMDYFELDLLFQKPFWLSLAAAAVGYVFARVSDKGPVGPLE